MTNTWSLKPEEIEKEEEIMEEEMEEEKMMEEEIMEKEMEEEEMIEEIMEDVVGGKEAIIRKAGNSDASGVTVSVRVRAMLINLTPTAGIIPLMTEITELLSVICYRVIKECNH